MSNTIFFLLFSDAASKLKPLFDENVLNSDTYNVSIKPIPPGSGGLAYYNSPSVDGRRKGAFFLNTQNIKANKKFEANSLTLHESNPGHHLQMSFNKHSPIPIFLRYNLTCVLISFHTYFHQTCQVDHYRYYLRSVKISCFLPQSPTKEIHGNITFQSKIDPKCLQLFWWIKS